MYCIHCRAPVRYNRALVREHDGRTLAGLCSECEREQFGRVLRGGYADPSGACLFCSRPGALALPVHRIDLDDGPDDHSETRGYPVEATTPRLCDGHAGEAFGLKAERLRSEATLATYAVDDD
ncbi:hypothetical protein [Halobaculum roseum]|uniref:Small CPxCG-related zinc finger protein n=1 Tax=Halobaculum roseum TaxID=2175149 RepID=A0ABD5MLS2_9EURY|nr:hypothetical protein [Halobaculum roseum]QZY02984.1 hypothetical protein K6T36_01975 [Halobaculum roseum]